MVVIAATAAPVAAVVRPAAAPAALLVVPARRPLPPHGAALMVVAAVAAVPADGVLARGAALAVHLGVVHLEVDRLQERECVQVEWCAN